ncbi:MAG TPA: hypothetical protein V6C97_21705 [Oculatellaceae cyanobacterium]
MDSKDYDFTSLEGNEPLLKPPGASPHPASAPPPPAVISRDGNVNVAGIEFTKVFGNLPLVKPNVRCDEDVVQMVNKYGGESDSTKWCLGTLCCLTGIGACYLGCCKTTLVQQGQVGFAMNSGRPNLLGPGWHVLVSPLNSIETTKSWGEDVITVSVLSGCPCVCLSYAPFEVLSLMTVYISFVSH